MLGSAKQPEDMEWAPIRLVVMRTNLNAQYIFDILINIITCIEDLLSSRTQAQSAGLV